jgi:hypothetical protein
MVLQDGIAGWDCRSIRLPAAASQDAAHRRQASHPATQGYGRRPDAARPAPNPRPPALSRRRHAAYLACPPGAKSCSKTADFAGPAWGHVNVRNTTIDWFLTVNSNYTGLVTLHWYKVRQGGGRARARPGQLRGSPARLRVAGLLAARARRPGVGPPVLGFLEPEAPARAGPGTPAPTANAPPRRELPARQATKEAENTAVTLLDEAPIRKEMSNLKELVRVSRSWGKPLRVAEMNTISNSGRDGVSNVFSAALWTLDAAFEVRRGQGRGWARASEGGQGPVLGRGRRRRYHRQRCHALGAAVMDVSAASGVRLPTPPATAAHFPRSPGGSDGRDRHQPSPGRRPEPVSAPLLPS